MDDLLAQRDKLNIASSDSHQSTDSGHQGV